MQEAICLLLERIGSVELAVSGLELKLDENSEWRQVGLFFWRNGGFGSLSGALGAYRELCSVWNSGFWICIRNLS